LGANRGAKILTVDPFQYLYSLTISFLKPSTHIDANHELTIGVSERQTGGYCFRRVCFSALFVGSVFHEESVFQRDTSVFNAAIRRAKEITKKCLIYHYRLTIG